MSSQLTPASDRASDWRLGNVTSPQTFTTTHYSITYNSSLSQADGHDRAQALAAVCEQDYAIMAGWFPGLALPFALPIPVAIVPGTGASASWDLTPVITLTPGNGANLTLVRYLLVSEVVEMFAKSLKAAVANSGWYYTAGGFEDEGQAGEALSLLLGAEFLVAAGLGSSMPGFDSANRWLGNGRTDYINTPPDRDNKHDAKVGCAILFLYYLKVQLGFSVLQIIQAGAPRLADVYRNLTGRQDDPFLRFKKILDRAFPDRSTITAGNLDNPYPLPNPPVDFDFVADAADSRIEIFPRGNDGHVWHLYQTEPNGDWSDWEDLSTYRPLPGGTPLTASNQPATGSAADGRIEIFARGTDNHVWHLYQTEPNGDWSNWEDLSTYRPLPGGTPLTASNPPAAGSAADGRIEIFVADLDGHAWHLNQTAPNGDWSDWEDLSTYRPGFPGF